MALFFPAERCTTVVIEDDYIVILQWTDSSMKECIGEIQLTEHQFLEIYNRYKHLLEELHKGGE